MSKMKNTFLNPSTMTVGVLAACGLALALFAGGFSQAAATQDDHDTMRLGTYEPQRAFQQYHGMQDFNQQMQRLQQQAQEAQQQGDQQRMMQIQQEMQQLQNQVVEQFHSDVENVIPKVAENAGVQLVAIDIVYAADDLGEPHDLTDQLIQQVNEEAGVETEQEPDMPW